MPDRYYILLGGGVGQHDIALMIIEINERVQTILSRLFGDEGELWDEDPSVLIIYTWQKLFERLNFIHTRPVAYGLVERPQDYPFSSAHYYQDKYGKSSFDFEELSD